MEIALIILIIWCLLVSLICLLVQHYNNYNNNRNIVKSKNRKDNDISISIDYKKVSIFANLLASSNGIVRDAGTQFYDGIAQLSEQPNEDINKGRPIEENAKKEIPIEENINKYFNNYLMRFEQNDEQSGK